MNPAFSNLRSEHRAEPVPQIKSRRLVEDVDPAPNRQTFDLS